MRISFSISAKERARALAFYRRHESNAFVRARRSKNVDGNRAKPTRDAFWFALLMGLLTTQQRSGPTSPISRFLELKPFPLTLRKVRVARSARQAIERALSDHGGIRMAPTIAVRATANLEWLEGGGWKTVLPRLERLHTQGTRELERAVAGELTASLAGVGPKQSRNILQYLGLTQYEIPLDSRITKWLNEYGFPVPLSAAPLSDEGYYLFVEDGVHVICDAIGVLPCLLDAAIFSSYDAGGWNP